MEDRSQINWAYAKVGFHSYEDMYNASSALLLVRRNTIMRQVSYLMNP